MKRLRVLCALLATPINNSANGNRRRCASSKHVVPFGCLIDDLIDRQQHEIKTRMHDDRWLYDQEAELGKVVEVPLEDVAPAVLAVGNDITLVASGYSVVQAMEVAEALQHSNIAVEVIDLRVLNPIRWDGVVASVEKTGHLLAIDGGWTSCGMAAEIIAAVSERINWKKLKAAPTRVTLTDSPAPTSGPLEDAYYTKTETIVDQAMGMLGAQH